MISYSITKQLLFLVKTGITREIQNDEEGR